MDGNQADCIGHCDIMHWSCDTKRVYNTPAEC